MTPYDFNLDVSTAEMVEAKRIFQKLFMPETAKNPVHGFLYKKGAPHEERDISTHLFEPVAIGYANGCYPWLLHVLESYDRDRIRSGCAPKRQALKLRDWMAQCDFFRDHLVKELDKRELVASIEKLYVFYIRKWTNVFRVLTSTTWHDDAYVRNEVEPLLIVDDLYEVTQVILGAYTFVKQLVALQPLDTKFQCEFAVAVRSTELEASQGKRLQTDVLGDFGLNLRQNGVPHQQSRVPDLSRFAEVCMANWHKFKAKIEAHQSQKKAKPLSTFPQRQRFCCLVDRREFMNNTRFRAEAAFTWGREAYYSDQYGDKQLEWPERVRDLRAKALEEWIRVDRRVERNPAVDEITFFVPNHGGPESRIYPETFLSRMSTSLVPRLKILDEAGEKWRRVRNGIGGATKKGNALLNLHFQIERRDEIRMYIIWESQCMRLHAEDFWLVLPRIFSKQHKNNAKFPSDQEMQRKIQETFEFPDKYFAYFYKHMSVYNQRWISGTTEAK